MINQANENQITPSFENLREMLIHDTMRGVFYGKTDEEKICTIVNRTQAILDAVFGTDDGFPETIDRTAARRVLHQVAGTYDDAVYTAQRRAGEILNALRGM